MSDNKAKLRAAIFKARPENTVTVTSPHLPDVTVEFRGLSFAERTVALRAAMQDGEVDAVGIVPLLIIASAYVPGTNDKLFSEGDLDAVSALPAVVTDDWGNAALKLNGLGKGDAEAAEKNSARTATSDSPSLSLDISA
jgi:hypothetical protein